MPDWPQLAGRHQNQAANQMRGEALVLGEFFLVLSETPFAVLPGACFEGIGQTYASASGLGWPCAMVIGFDGCSRLDLTGRGETRWSLGLAKGTPALQWPLVCRRLQVLLPLYLLARLYFNLTSGWTSAEGGTDVAISTRLLDSVWYGWMPGVRPLRL